VKLYRIKFVNILHRKWLRVGARKRESVRVCMCMCARKWERVCVYVCMCMRKWERVCACVRYRIIECVCLYVYVYVRVSERESVCVGKKNSVLVCVWVRECVCVWVRKIEFIYTICCTKALKIINLAFLWFLVNQIADDLPEGHQDRPISSLWGFFRYQKIAKIDTSTPAIKCLKCYIAFYNLK